MSRRFAFMIIVMIAALAASCGLSFGGILKAALPDVTLWGVTYSNNDFSAVCIGCHTENPSTHIPNTALPFTDTEADYRGSHFVRNKLDGTDDFTANKTIEKISIWTNSGGLSKYGDTNTQTSITLATGELLCESCHSIKSNVGYKLLLDYYNTTTGDSSLCNGCHSSKASGPPNHHAQTGHDVGADGDDSAGLSHELDISHFSRLISPSPNDLNRDANSDQVGYYGGVLSCMSCHKPHDAMTSTGARIIRRGRSTSTASGVTNRPVNVVYAAGVPSAGYAVGEVIMRSSTGLHRQSDMAPLERLVTNYDPLCQSCH